ncbi:hypothetical protein TNCV_4401201, partial [Trichonephila clavipes]
DFMRGRIIERSKKGEKITDVASSTSLTALFHGCGSHLKLLNVVDGTGGRVRSTTPAEDRYIVLSAKRNRRTTAQQSVIGLIWRERRCTAYRPKKYPGKADRCPIRSIMVWAGIMINGRTRLHVVMNGTMTGQRYIDEILLPPVRLFRGAVGDKFVFGRQRNMSLNTRCSGLSEIARVFNVLVWPAFSRSKPH